MNFVGPALRRTPTGLENARKFIGCDLPALESVLQVETGGSGFDSQKRPKMLFEPHIFYARLNTIADKGPLQRAVANGLAYPKQGEKPYPADSYPRLLAAMQIDQEFALQSASWGAPQILGENYTVLGFTSAVAMVTAFIPSEDGQILGMAHFIKAKLLATPLIQHDWAKFAAGYNGPAYRRNNYDVKLAQAYSHFSAGNSTVGAVSLVSLLAMPAPYLDDTPAEINHHILNYLSNRTLGLWCAQVAIFVLGIATVVIMWLSHDSDTQLLAAGVIFFLALVGFAALTRHIEFTRRKFINPLNKEN